MKVVYSVLGAAVLAGLVACSSAKPATATQAGATTTTTPSTSDDDSSDTSSTPAAATTTDAGTTDPDAATDTDAAVATTITPQTCDTLAAAASTPAGTLQITSIHGITPLDVFATQDDNGLTIVLTTTANECGYRQNNLAHESMKELQFITPTPNGGFVPGNFEPSQVKEQQGQQCFPQDGDFEGNGGQSFEQGSARGTITITAIDASSVTGTIDVTDFEGRRDTFSFTAPICAVETQAQVQAATCCADPNP